MKLSAIINESIHPNPGCSFTGGGRTGTAHLTLDQCAEIFGPPHALDSNDGKVTQQWHFQTPRGPVTIRDYWWNATNEQSIASPDFKSALWLAAYLRRKGFAAHLGMRR